MKTFAVTGATGLLGSNLVLHILKEHLDALDGIRIFVIGRGGSLEVHQRVAAQIRKTGWPALMAARDEALLDRACAVLAPIELDVTDDRAALSPTAAAAIGPGGVDELYHIAALTDFRRQSHVEERLRQTNVGGTRNVLRLVDAIPGGVRKLAFVGSAYACGKTVGSIAPDYTNIEQEFRNPYERSKLESEVLARRSCQERSIPCKVFRPSTIGGRLLAPPIGHVTKCDVYLGWLYFFLRLKSKILNTSNWAEICATPVEIPIRIQANLEVGLNIVGADVAAAAMYSAMQEDDVSRSYHLVSERDLPVGPMLDHMLTAAGVTGWSIVRQRPQSEINRFERIYYASVGDIYTPYVIHERNMDFEHSATIRAWNGHGPLVSVDTVGTFAKLVRYAFDKKFDMAD